MAVLSDVTSGTISVANGSTAVTGVGTAWQIQGFREGDLILKDNYSGVIASVNSDTSITLVDGWVGTSLVAAPYRIRYAADGERVTAKAQQLIDSLTNGMLGQIYDLVPEPNTVIGFDASGIGELFPIFDLIQGVQVDAKVEDLAGRAAYDGNAAGFSVLVADVGDGRSAIYFKNSNTSGDWSDPAYLTGENGSFQSEGDWSNAVTYNQGQVVYYQGSSWISVQNAPNLNHAPPTLPTTSNAWWTILARAASGFTFRGVYSGATAYVKDDVVTDQNASWIALQATTGNAPPALPTTVNANWQLIVLGSGAFKGDYAAGTQYVYGDIVFNQNSSWVAKIATIGNAPPTLPTTSNTQWQAVALGKNGTFRGDYAGGTAYIIGDTVLYNNSTWQAIAATTGNTPPALPATVNTWWQLVAAKGTGDVNGPASSIVGNFSMFSTTTGKDLADSGIPAFTALQDNLVCNPAMQVSEQNGNTAGTTTLYYAADQWRSSFTAIAGVVSFARVASKTPRGSRYRLRATVTTADASVAAGDVYNIQQPIEGFRLANIGWDGATGTQLVLRFGFKGPAGTYSGFYKNGAANRSYVFNFTVSVANTDTEIIAVIPPDTTGGVWPSDESVSGVVGVSLMTGTTYTATPNTWVTGNFLGTTGTFNALGTVGNVVELFDVGLYPDPLNTGKPPVQFVIPSYEDDLFECQRYYHRFSAVGAAAAIGGAAGVFTSATATRVVMQIYPAMRDFPTIAYSAASDFTFVGVTAQIASAISSASAAPNKDCFVIEGTVPSSNTAGMGCYMRSANANAVIAAIARM